MENKCKMKERINSCLYKKNNNYLINLRIIVILFILSLLAIMIIPRADALGITPGRTTMNFQKGLEQSIEFSVLNTESKDMSASLRVEGELRNYVELTETKVVFSSAEESKQFSYKVNLPDSLEPGLHTAEIIAFESPREGQGETHVGATVAVVSQLYVYVPCPGKCIDADADILNPQVTENVTFIVPVINRGKTGIDETKAVIDLYSGAGKAASIETNVLPISAGSRAELTGILGSIAPGEYNAKITVYYDGEKKEFEKKFSIGSQKIAIGDIYVNDFHLGGIAKMIIVVENKWNEELKAVYANLVVYTIENSVLADVKSASEDIQSMARKELIAYWDTVGIDEGEYDARLMIKYSGESADRNLLLRLSENSFDITTVGYAVSAKSSKGLSLTTILIGLVVILLIGNLAWFIIFKMRKRNKNKAMNKNEKKAKEERKEENKGGVVRVK